MTLVQNINNLKSRVRMGSCVVKNGETYKTRLFNASVNALLSLVWALPPTSE